LTFWQSNLLNPPELSIEEGPKDLGSRDAKKTTSSLKANFCNANILAKK
jgi:hypothetical protein